MLTRCPTPLETVARRIERAYLRRRPWWSAGCSDPRVWMVAASALLDENRVDPTIPVDPELFVATQPRGPSFDDPWRDLTGTSARRRYRVRVRRIIRRLREELDAEVSQAEGRLRGGKPVEDVLKGRWLSPLGRFIVAHRAGRPDLAEPWRTPARDQHRACPLYRPACRHLLPGEVYPIDESASWRDLPERAVAALPQFSAN